jgi:UDP-2-acetamido-2-deoxy-ribo-hexuluronate aminotransferase
VKQATASSSTGEATSSPSEPDRQPGPGDFFLPDTDVPDLEFAGIKAQYAALRGAIAPRVGEVFRHGRFIMGPEVEELEAALASYCGVDHVIGVSSGTDALTAPMLAMEIGPGDAVFLPAFTFTATAEVPLLLGASPVFVDVDPRTFNIDLEDLEAKIAAVRAAGDLKPRAIVPVDLFGVPAAYGAINALAQAEGLTVLGDAAQSFGGLYHNRRVGSLTTVTATSFFPAKPFGCFGDGGAIFTDDADLADRIRSVRNHGQGAEKYTIDRVGLNARLDSLQAAVLLGKLPALDDEIEARNRLADTYDEALGDVCQTPLRVEGSRSAFAQYTILIDNRDAVQARLGDTGIPTAIYYPKPMHFQGPYAKFGDGPGSLPVSEALSEKVLSLPMHGYMADAVADRIADDARKAITAG